MKKNGLINTGTGMKPQKGAMKGLVNNPSAGMASRKGFNKQSLITSGVGGKAKKTKKAV